MELTLLVVEWKFRTPQATLTKGKCNGVIRLTDDIDRTEISDTDTGRVKISSIDREESNYNNKVDFFVH